MVIIISAAEYRRLGFHGLVATIAGLLADVRPNGNHPSIRGGSIRPAQGQNLGAKCRAPAKRCELRHAIGISAISDCQPSLRALSSTQFNIPST